MQFHAYATTSPKTSLEPFRYEADLGPEDVEIRVACCGVCHSDVHLADGDWGDVFPLVPGHEIVGTVTSKGSHVRLEVGQRVGVGWQCDSCGTCEWCRSGEEVLCAEHQATCQGHHGGFADRLIVNERFAVPLPDALESTTAAPLLCGGVTVYSPLRRYARPSSRVAVVGIGGLGHLGLQFARAMGCQVTAISRSADKEADARRFGAEHFLVGTPEPSSFDLILNTAHASLDMQIYIDALRPKGVFCQLGAPPDPMSVPALAMIPGHKAVAGSGVGHPLVIGEMFAFAARHGVAAEVETMPMSQVNEALEKTRSNRARFRVVLQN